MDLNTVKNEIIVESNKYRLGPRVLKLHKLSNGSATKITKIRNVNGAIVPDLGSAPISLLDIDSFFVFPLTLKLPILFPNEVFEDNDLAQVFQKSLSETFHFASIENKLVVDVLIAGAGKIINSESKPNVREIPILDNFISAIRFIEDNNYHPNKIIIHPSIAETLRQRDELKDKLVAYAIEVIVENSVPEGTVIILDSNHSGLLIERVSPEVSEYVDHWNQQKGFLVRSRVAPVITDGNAVVVIS